MSQVVMCALHCATMMMSLDDGSQSSPQLHSHGLSASIRRMQQGPKLSQESVGVPLLFGAHEQLVEEKLEHSMDLQPLQPVSVAVPGIVNTTEAATAAHGKTKRAMRATADTSIMSYADITSAAHPQGV